MLRTLCLAAGLGLAALPVLAQDVPVETAKLGKSGVTLHVHPFLTDEELATLRLVMTNKDALAVFVPGKPGSYAALAMSPDEGFIRDGQPVASAMALADFPDAATAAAEAAAACDAARKAKSKAPCVVVLEVGPAG
jgi:hypothetical protein